MEKIKIAILDSGVMKNHSHFCNDTITGFSLQGGEPQEIYNDEFGHGTAIYNIIRECRDFADIINIKINEIEDGVSENKIIETLYYIYNSMNVDIINGCAKFFL